MDRQIVRLTFGFPKPLAILLFLLINICDTVDASENETGFSALADLSLAELLEVKVTSVSRQPEKLSESPSAVQVITADQIRRSGATTIPEALRLASNLNIVQQNSHEWFISARGFNSSVGNKLLVMIDGRTVYTPLFSGVFWDRQSYLLEDIERIEVVSGPGATLWGANAVNGVINIITRSADDTQGSFVEVGAGTTLESIVGLRYGGRLQNTDTSYRVYSKFSERGEEYLSDGSEGVDAWSMAQAGFRVDGAINQANTWTLQGDYYRNAPGKLFDKDTYATGGNILARWNYTASDTSDMSLQFYFDQAQVDLPFAAAVINGVELAPAGILHDQLDTVDIDFQHRFTPGTRQEVIWGLAYRYTNDQLQNAPSVGFYPEHLEQELLSAFIQDEITLINNTVSLTLGTKVEETDYTGTEWEPSARLKWTLSDNSVLWSAISRAVRTPSRIDRDFSQPTRVSPLILLRGGENFDSEKVMAYEIGYRGTFADKFIASIAGFYNEYTDVRSTSFTPDTILPFFFENNLEGETQGVELNVSFQAFTWWQINTGYNYLEEDIRVKEGAFDLNNALNETADPRNQFSLHSSMTFNTNFEFDLGARWVDELRINNNGEPAYVPEYGEVDIRLGWKLRKNIELSLVGQNLLHKHHQEFGIPGPTQREVGRNIYSKFQLHF